MMKMNGTEVYYTGNMANPAAFGTIVGEQGFHWKVAFQGQVQPTHFPKSMLVKCDKENVTNANKLFVAEDRQRVRNEIINNRLRLLGR